MNIQLIQHKNDKDVKWLVWKRNIGRTYFSHMMPFNEEIVWKYLSDISAGRKYGENLISNLSIDDSKLKEKDRLRSSLILPTDIYRNFTMEEYTLLSIVLLSYGYRYNKKKDEFIKIL